jgi:uncharacterized protein
MFYLDASILVAIVAFEESQERVRAWIGKWPPEVFHVSPWVGTEVSSALSIKVRTGAISMNQRKEAVATYAKLLADSLSLLSVSDAHFETASRYIDNVSLGLRGGDALHLAVSHANGLTLATLDKQLAEAGPQLGAATLLL